MDNSENPTFMPAGKGHSFFNFVKQYCLDEASGVAANRAFHRLCSLMRKMGVMTVIIENPPVDSKMEMLDLEVSALKAYYGHGQVDIHAHRFTFVDVEITKAKQLQGLKDQHFLSSCILINFQGQGGHWISYIFQAFVALPRVRLSEGRNVSPTWLPLLNNYLHILRTFPCRVGVTASEARTFSLTGTFFCQQNTVTSVCAHAAICMAINNMNVHGIDFVTPEDINGILDFDHRFKKLKLNGQDFRKSDFEKVFNNYQLAIAHKDFLDDKVEDYDAYIYKYVESKCPTLLVFTTDDEKADHVVPVFGHTLNADMWTPEAKITYSKPRTLFDIYQSTALWVDHFVIHDDNLGMYYCLPTHALKQPVAMGGEYAFKAMFGIAIVPPGVLTPSREAQWATASVLDKLFEKLKTQTAFDHWTETLISSYRDTYTPRVVAVRTFLISKAEYAESLHKSDFEGNKFSSKDKANLTNALPDLFWLSEVTLPDIFTANKSKLIDFFYSCTDPSTDNTEEWDRRWIQIRLPGALRLNTKESTSVSLSVKSHYPLIRLEEGKLLLEW